MANSNNLIQLPVQVSVWVIFSYNLHKLINRNGNIIGKQQNVSSNLNTQV